MRADRLVAALLLMESRGRLTAAELARELEISVATARRDLEALSTAGIPVYPQPGRGGGWSLVGGARTDLSGLSVTVELPNQQELVRVLARRGFPVTQATLSRDINELRLVRSPEGYTLPNGDGGGEPAPAVSRVVREFVREVRRAQNLLVIKTAPNSPQLVEAPKAERDRLSTVAASLSEEDLTRYLQIVLRLYQDLHFSPQPRLL